MQNQRDARLPHDSHHPGSVTLRVASERFGSLPTQSGHRRMAPWAETKAAIRAAR
jgi:hypothetical protein